MKKYNVAVVGATGAVGNEMIRMLEERDFPVASLRLVASSRSIGKKLKYKGQAALVEELTKDSFKGVEIALFSAGGAISKEFAPVAAGAGVFVIDNSSAWRMDKDVPLVVPEVNPHDLKKEKKIIANPNCSTIQLVVVLKPIHAAAKIKRVVVSTYQAVSGAGHKAMVELAEQVKSLAKGGPAEYKVFPYQIAYNVIPQIDVFLDNDYTREEMKMVLETQKIMGDDSIQVTATAVRVPVMRGHSESVNIETEKHLTAVAAKKMLAQAPGVILIDDPANKKYPLALDCAGKIETFVGRIRQDESIKNGLNLWIVSDNLLKGAAWNAVQIAEELVKQKIV
ncbi:MAG: aspartate-semialdehyde dehydrogenase [Elusimicrobia bacterium]|nr:aspartate-semialdehyde dehydrogenase [Elusimicrobiota bacterium]